MNGEKKYLQFPMELKSDESDDGTFTAYVSVFGNEDSYGDIVEKGAFKKALRGKKSKVFPLLYQHDPSEVIGGFRAKEDDHGLKMVDAFFNLDIQRGKEAYSNAKKGLLSGFSIGYSVDDFEIDKKGRRLLQGLTLWEGSIVTFPANEKAQLTDIKSIATVRDFEKFLRESGFSKSQATQIASKGFTSLQDDQRDSDNEAEELKTALKGLKTIITSI